MADIRCKNCQENLGKCTENGTTVHCGTCNTTQKNWMLKEYYPKIWKEVKEEEREWEEQQKIPKQVTDILNTHDQDADPYHEAGRLVSELESIGWTAEWGLSGELYELKRINL